MKKTTHKTIAPASEPKAQPETKQPHYDKPAYLRAELTEAQLRTCELASDMIMNGGHESDVKALVAATLRHDWRRKFPDWEQPNPYGRLTTPTEHATNWLPRTFTALVKGWPAERPEVERPAPSTVEEMALDHVRQRLEDEFGEFMGDADLGSVYLLREILNDVTSNGDTLPHAFATEIGADHTWIQVPDAHVERVEKFVELLPKVKTEAA